MLLLLGGTSETAQIATRLAEAGLSILVSTATDEPLESAATRASSAAPAGSTRPRWQPSSARKASARSWTPRTRTPPPFAPRQAEPLSNWGFPTSASSGQEASLPQARILPISIAPSHAEAARLAFSFGRPVLLTTGANNLAPYAEQSRQTGIPLVARVLPRPESVLACAQAGILQAQVIAAKGPFSVNENRAHIRQHRIGVLVTKDSGEAGGVPAKLDAARREGCRVVIVQRPALPTGRTHATVDGLVADILGSI